MTVARVVRADALRLPLADESVDLIVTSPPYFALRSYRDGDGHYDGQVGSEPTPQAFLEALWAVMAECWRVLKPTGSCWVNLGDKRSGSGGHNNAGLSRNGITGSLHNGKPPPSAVGKNQTTRAIAAATRRNAPDRYNQAAFGRAKSKMLLPHRFAIGCEDGLADPEGKGWIMRQDVVWAKRNGLPESATDRCRDSHEYLFHLTKSERYYSAVDEVREPQPSAPQVTRTGQPVHRSIGRVGVDDPRDATKRTMAVCDSPNPLGKLPGSVWEMASEPLRIPDAVKAYYALPDHFAAFPTELPRRIILGWSPPAICTACGEGRRPVVTKELRVRADTNWGPKFRGTSNAHQHNRMGNDEPIGSTEATITGYACSCWPETPPTRRAVVLDPFAGTGTTIGVAEALGRTGIGVDLSMDYCRLARWRVEESGHFHKAAGMEPPVKQILGQGALL